MDVSDMLSQEQPKAAPMPLAESPALHSYSTRHSLSGAAVGDQEYSDHRTASMIGRHGEGVTNGLRLSPPPGPKNVAFELHFDGAPSMRGRLPMRVQIFPHDTTESIVTTVKNFYGLYDGAAQGVSFEDQHGATLIASYENFVNNMVVYVRVTAEYAQAAAQPRPEYPAPWDNSLASTSPQRTSDPTDPALQMPPPQAGTPGAAPSAYGPMPLSRPGSRVSRRQSQSPNLGAGRSASAQKARSRSGAKGSFTADGEEHNDAHNGYSSSDCGAGSVTSSRKARSEQLASAEISVENIVEGGRRKKPKFSSSELPLYVPPQVPAPNSISSISPQRRSNGAEVLSPFARPTQRTFTYSMPVQSPQDLTSADRSISAAQPGMPFPMPPVPNHSHRLRERSSAASLGPPAPRGRGAILPTPDPTIASCISDEDVALQLMRLSDVSNFSHGRTSNSTMDDGLSGRAEAASSATSATDGDESDESEDAPDDAGVYGRPTVKREFDATDGGLVGPVPKKQRRTLDAPFPDGATPGFARPESNGLILKPKTARGAGAPKAKRPRNPGPGRPPKTARAPDTAGPKRAKTSAAYSMGPLSAPGFPAPPMSPASLPPGSRKVSLSALHTASLPGMHTPGGPAAAAAHASPASTTASAFGGVLGPDEDDLSSKPRCQRCRKSKKGCDRQRPCQRCKDAGIGADGCISEDEGNGRKGRYGRHMGISVRKSLDQQHEEVREVEGAAGGWAPQWMGAGEPGPGFPGPMSAGSAMGYAGLGASDDGAVGEKGKKRKKMA